MMSKKMKDELVFVISAFIIGILYFSSHQESSTFLWAQVIFVLTFAVRKTIGIIATPLINKKKHNQQQPHNKVTHISAKY